jgi:hypothetical protein
VGQVQVGGEVCGAVGEVHVCGQAEQDQAFVAQGATCGAACGSVEADVRRLVGGAAQLHGVYAMAAQQGAYLIER